MLLIFMLLIKKILDNKQILDEALHVFDKFQTATVT